MNAPPLWLVNPPSPPGQVANREGFGGLGVLTPGRKGFVYPALRLAEAAARARELGARVRVSDYVLGSPWRRVWPAPRDAAVIVQVARVSWDHDRRFVASLLERDPSRRVVVTGVGSPAEFQAGLEVSDRLRIHTAPTGFGAADLALGMGASSDPFADPQTWLPADWRGIPLGSSRRPGLYHGRGCGLQCNYCPYVVATGRRHLVRDAAATAGEFQTLASSLRPKRIVFRDPVFAYDSDSTLDLVERMAQSDQRVPFEIETRPELLLQAPGLLQSLARAGCAEIKLGVETFEPAALEESGRLNGPRLQASIGAGGERAERYADSAREVLDRASAAGIDVRLFLMSGLPGQTAKPPVELGERARWMAVKHRMPVDSGEEQAS